MLPRCKVQKYERSILEINDNLFGIYLVCFGFTTELFLWVILNGHVRNVYPLRSLELTEDKTMVNLDVIFRLN